MTQAARVPRIGHRHGKGCRASGPPIGIFSLLLVSAHRARCSWLVARGSWLVALGSSLSARGSSLAHGSWPDPDGPHFPAFVAAKIAPDANRVRVLPSYSNYRAVVCGSGRR